MADKQKMLYLPVRDAGGEYNDYGRFVQPVQSLLYRLFGKYGCQRFKLLAE